MVKPSDYQVKVREFDTWHLFFFSLFFVFRFYSPLFFSLYFFSMGGGVLCMYVPFFCATHHPPVITTAVLRVVPTLRAHSASTHRPGAHGLLEVPGIIHSGVLFSYWCKNSFDLTAESFACTVFTYEIFGTKLKSPTIPEAIRHPTRETQGHRVTNTHCAAAPSAYGCYFGPYYSCRRRAKPAGIVLPCVRCSRTRCCALCFVDDDGRALYFG